MEYQPWKINYFYNNNGILTKSYNDFTGETLFYKYSLGKLSEILIENFDNELLGVYKFFYSGNILVRKSYLENIYEGMREDSTFIYKYDYNKNLIEERLVAIENLFALNKRFILTRLIKYKYNGNNLIEKVKYGKNKSKMIDETVIDEKITFKYDEKNRIKNEKHEGEKSWRMDFTYFYKEL